MTFESKELYLNYPTVECCTSSAFIGEPKSGKTFAAMESCKYWMKNNVFDTYLLIIPQFKNEQNDSYAFLRAADPKKVTILETFSPIAIEKLLAQQKKNADLFDAGKLKVKPKALLIIDDATSQVDILACDALLSIVTENRHLCVHSLFIMHAYKKVIDTRVRQNFKFFFIYYCGKSLMHDIYDDFVSFNLDFDDFNDFYFWLLHHVTKQKFGCLFLNGHESFSITVADWFKADVKQPTKSVKALPEK